MIYTYIQYGCVKESSYSSLYIYRATMEDEQIAKSWTEQLFAKNSCQEQQSAEFAKKMTCHNYLLKLCNIYQVDKCKIRIL